MKFRSVGCFCWLWQAPFRALWFPAGPLSSLPAALGSARFHMTKKSHLLPRPGPQLMVVFTLNQAVSFTFWLSSLCVQLIHPAERWRAECRSCCQHRELGERSPTTRSLWLFSRGVGAHAGKMDDYRGIKASGRCKGFL